MSTATRIFHLLDVLDVDQKDFAKEIGISDKVVSKWKTGESKSYTKYLCEIVAFFGVPFEYFLEAGVLKNWEKIMEYPVSVYGKLRDLLPWDYRDPMIDEYSEQLAWLDKRMCYNETGPCEIELINWFHRNVIEVKISKDNDIPERYEPAMVELTLKDYILANSSRKGSEFTRISSNDFMHLYGYHLLSPANKAIVDRLIEENKETVNRLIADMIKSQQFSPLQDNSDKDIEIKVENYRRRLIMEKDQPDTSSPSNGAGGETA